MTSRLFSIAIIALVFAPSAFAVPANVSVFYRSGQTFITWDEDGGSYDIYRHSQAITAGTIGSATRIASGIPAGSANLLYGDIIGVSRVVLTDYTGPADGIGTQLAAGKGFFCYTPHNPDSGDAYYAVTSAGSQTVSASNAPPAPVREIEAPPGHVVARISDNGAVLGVIQFLDYAIWGGHSFDPTYIYIFGVRCPVTPPSSPAPMTAYLHGYGAASTWTGATSGGEYEVAIDDRRCTWHYGYLNEDDSVGNYTEARIVDAYDWVIRHFSIDTNRIYAYGSSMGGTGSLTLALRYPNFLAACFASKGMTNFDDPGCNWYNDVTGKWGSHTVNPPIVNVGRFSGHLQKWNGTPVYRWSNHHEMLYSLAKDETAFISSSHGSYDESVVYPYEGGDFYKHLNNTKRGFVGWIRAESHSGANWTCTPNIGHYDWMINNPGQNGGLDFRFRKDYSFPAFSNSHFVGDYTGPAVGGTKYYHWNLMWGCPWVNAYSQLMPDSCTMITDTDSLYKIWIQVFTESGTGYLPSRFPSDIVDITPRRLQHFSVLPGATYDAQNINASGTVLQTQTLSPDTNNLVTFTDFTASSTGSWLVIRPSGTAIERRRLEQQLAASYCILLNSPNPCNPSTDITYRVVAIGTSDKKELVSLRVYNAAGACVRGLAEGAQAPGEYRVVWNGKNDRGQSCASGVYTLRLTVGDKTYQRAVVLSR